MRKTKNFLKIFLSMVFPIKRQHLNKIFLPLMPTKKLAEEEIF